MRNLSVALFALLMPAAALADLETFECDTTDGFSLTDFTGTPPRGATLSAQKGSLVLEQDRARLAAVLHATLLTELCDLRITVASTAAIPLAILVPDRDGARWIHVAAVPAGKPTVVSARPEDFRLADDSPVRKDRMEPDRLGFGYVLFDAGFLQGASGQGKVRIDRIEIERRDLPTACGDWVVDSPVRVDASTMRRGSVVVKRGGELVIDAPRFVLEGDLKVVGGSVTIDGGVWVQPQAYNHQRRINVKDGGRFRFTHALSITHFPLSLEIGNGCEYVTEATEQIGGMTASLGETARVTCEGASGINEFVIPAGARCDFRGSTFLILWLALGPNLQGDASLPNGAHVDSWEAGAGHAVSVTDCSDVKFCVVSNPGARGQVVDSDVYGAGLLFPGGDDTVGSAPVTVRGLIDGERVESLHIDAPDRDLTFARTKVEAWNVYPAGNANVTIDRCTFGETLAFGESHEEVLDSTCDGRGGYFGAQDRSSITARNCTIQSLVVARDGATIVLMDCRVEGEVRAAGTSSIRLVRTSVTGAKVAEPGATIVEEP